MTLLEMKNALRALEARVAALETKPTPVPPVVAEVPNKKMKMCPKCNAVPAYFFHVKNCRGP
jgi:hypothetical protein